MGAVLLIMFGCGEGTGELSGTVTCNSKPVRMGTVTVAGSDGVIRQGEIRDDGTYVVVGLSPGPVRIGVSSPNPKSSKVHMRKKGETAPTEDASKWMPIPDKYADFQVSNLGVDVKPGKNTFNIDLK